MKKIHYPQCAVLDKEKKTALQLKLRRNIIELNRRLQALQASRNASDFQLVNTYKSMILERNSILTAIDNISPFRL